MYLSRKNAKVATVVPIDKKTDGKYVISNYRPVSLLNGFSKIYEIHLKNHLIFSTKQHLSNLVSTYRKNYSSQHVLIRLLEERTKCLDNNYVVSGVLMDLPKAFDCVPHELLIAKLEAYGINETFLITFIHIFHIANNAYASIMLQVISKQSCLGLHKAPLQVPFCLTAFLMTSFIVLKKQAFTILRMATP